MKMYAYHYPGLENIEPRRGHWELQLPLERVRSLYADVNVWPQPICTIAEYISKRDNLAHSSNLDGFLHFYYSSGGISLWSETAEYVCSSTINQLPIALVWCWKYPHMAPLSSCMPYALIDRSDQRDSIRNMKDISLGVKLIANQFMKSQNYLKLNRRPLLFLYHLEGWQCMCADIGINIYHIRTQFHKYKIDPFIVGVSVLPGKFPPQSVTLQLDAVTRYNDLPDFTGPAIQEFRTRTKGYMADWQAMTAKSKMHSCGFLPCLSLGWNASLRYCEANQGNMKNGYPLNPIVKGSSESDIQWAIQQGIKMAKALDITELLVCAWNEWTENASLEYYLYKANDLSTPKKCLIYD